MATKIKLTVPRDEGDEMSDFLCVGDYICLYCEEIEGYVFSAQTSSVYNGIHIYHRQDRVKPKGIPNPHAVVFQVCIANRYKLNKKQRKLVSSDADTDNLEVKAAAAQAKAAADAENDDNIAEQRRQQGKRVRYGEIIQLKHQFTGKYIHVSTTQTSKRDKNNMMVSLQNYNAKHCQFRILPRYKVKSEGEVVQILDQITFESVKSPGQYFHASVPYSIDNLNYGSELNLGVDLTGFTVVKYYKPSEGEEGFLRGGSVIRLFHKELEAYLVAEGLFDEVLTEDVHLRIREVDQLVPKTLYPSSSGITFWQVEEESSILHGEVIRWEQQVRFRHLTTRLYLCLKEDRTVCLTDNATDPHTVFRLHPIVKETDEIQVESYTRIEHVLSGFWLHAVRDEEYKRKQMQGTEDDDSMRGLRWDGASLRKIAASGERMYHDAYTIQKAEEIDMRKFNFVAGMVPFLLNLIHDFEDRMDDCGPGIEEPYMSPSRSSRTREVWSGPHTQLLHTKRTLEVSTSLRELKEFMIVSGLPTKDHQKLMRNLRIIDLIVKLLKFPIQGAPDQANLCELFKAAYDVLHTYMLGNSRKNALYFAKYIDFFQTQFHIKLGNIGLNVAQMIVELIRDNRKIVDRITRSQIDEFVDLLRENKNYRYLDLLSVLCVCDGVAIPDNQTYITENWLMKDQSGLFLTERGQNIRRQTNVVYVSPDSGDAWIPLHDFVNDKESHFFSEDDVLFLEHQLDLFRKLCYGRNEFAIETISQELGYLCWEEAFLCLRLHLLPDALRAKYCDLIIGLFVDVGNNYSVLEYNNISFVYDDVDSHETVVTTDFTGELVVKDLVTIFPVLRDWIKEFLDDNHGMVASNIGHNMLIEQVLRLLHYLVKYGYYGNARDIQELQKPLLNLLDGKNDLPFPNMEGQGQGTEKLKKHGYSSDARKLVEQYRRTDRYLKNPETTAIVNAKYQALEVMDLILTYQFSKRLRTFVSMFKQAERSLQKKKAGALQPLLHESFDALDQNKKAVKEQKKMVKVLKDMFESTAFFDVHELTTVLLDLTNYKYDKMVTKSLAVVNKYFSSKMDMFKSATQAQVLITPESCRVHKDLLKCLPVLRRLSKSKLNDQQVEKMSAIMDSLIRMCLDETDSEEPHPMNQSILINHEVLSLVFDNLSQEIDIKLMEQYRGIKTIVIKNIELLNALAKGNDVVQRRIYDRMDSLLKVKVVESQVASALQQAFIGNQSTCLKVQSKQIEKIVCMVGEHQHKVPELLELLRAIVKVDSLDIPLKRNQSYVMKFIMQYYSKTATVLDQPRDVREKILSGKQTENHIQYMTCLVDLLATCAEGENRFIESLCQTILPLEEILWVLTNPNITNHIKKPYLKYLHWVFMRSSGSFIDTGAGELTHHSSLWRFIQCLITDVNHTTHYINNHREHIIDLVKRPPKMGKIIGLNDTRGMAHANIHFILDAFFPFLRTFFSKFYSVDKDSYSKEPECVNELTTGLQEFCETLKPYLISPTHLKTILVSMTTILTSSTLKHSNIEGFIEGFGSVEWFTNREAVSIQSGNHYYASEVDLNHKFHIFAVNCSLLYGGHNTVACQLKYNVKWAHSQEYTNIGGDEVLPLGEEFQDHIRCFVKTHEKKTNKQYELAAKIIEQLGISANHPRQTEAVRLEHEELNIKSLQLLRAMIHNEIVKLPDEWEDYPHKYRKQLQKIFEIQNVLADKGCVNNILPLLARTNDEIVRETLAFMAVILFNANKHVQKTMIDYFKATREEVFFLSVRNRMQLSTVAIKERRALAAQEEARVKEVMSQAKSMQSVMSVSRKALQQIQIYETTLKRSKLSTSKRVSLASLQFKASKQKGDGQGKHNDTKEQKNKTGKQKQSSFDSVHSKNSSVKSVSPRQVRFMEGGSDQQTFKSGSRRIRNIDHMEAGVIPEIEMKMKSVTESSTDQGEDNMGYTMDESGDVTEEGLDLEYKDEGYIELVLRVMGQMCDGQFQGLQDYLRDQPDNIKSFNIVAEVTSFLNMVYSNINSNTIDLVIQIFSALNEFAGGNQPNRAVILTHKVVDYINFILRAEEFEDCSPVKVLKLRQAIGNLLYSMIEESGPEEMVVAKEVKDTLDKDALYRIMAKAYELHQIEKPKLDDLIQKKNITNIRGAIKSAKTLAKEGSKYMREVVEANGPGVRESLIQLGFTYYFILHRFFDLEPKLQNQEMLPTQEKAFKYYKKNSLSVEILKDEYLQKVNFRVKHKNVLREEVKEKLKWSVDRSSPSNKIRDLMMWSKDILKDIHYQRRILSNILAAFMTKRWLWWNYGVIILSLVINVLMLISWEAPLSIGDIPKNDTMIALPPEIHDPNPKIKDANFYYTSVNIAGFVHNVFSLLVLVSYFLSNHPKFPNITTAITKGRQLLGKHEDDNDDEKAEEKHISKLEVQFFSAKTFYYLTMFTLSLAGSFSQGYFFAFHLLNIVNNNQLLGGVIQAITQNGKSLLWVAVLGLVIFYLYAIVGFAFFRDMFDPDNYMYCKTLFECTVSFVRYGLIGDYDEMFKRHKEMNNFTTFAYMSIFNISFFIIITTIGLNIIFGIIVDTFSELRDLKWTAESDMRDTCFICSRKSYDFEHHAQGFTAHVKYEHNMWAYIFFFIHLDDKKINDYTAIDLYVSTLLQQERYDFFPLNRALSLTLMDEDSTESKIDELLQYVLSLVQKQKEEESEKKRQEERLQQQRWQELHRRTNEPTDQTITRDPNAALRRMLQVRDTGSSAENAVSLYSGQDRDKPDNILRPQVVSFRIEIENRYKLKKKYRQLDEAISYIGQNKENTHQLQAAKEAADAETRDNEAEQKRLIGKKIKYGDIIQLKHLFTEKYLHVNSAKTSQRDKTCVQTYLQVFNGKEAQFKVLPKFKVNTEGEFVRVKDQVVIESVKYPGQYLTASKPFSSIQAQYISELNLGCKSSAFTLVKRNNPNDEKALWGGAIVQFHHKDLEAYLSAEGDKGKHTEDVHFLISDVNQPDNWIINVPMYMSTYWQIEHADSIIKGETFEWGQHIRIQHLQTYQYLSVRDDLVTLCNDPADPVTIFKIHPMYEDLQLHLVSVEDGMFVKLEHVVTGRWLHAEKSESYVRCHKLVVPRKEKLTKVNSIEELQYQDAFSLERMDLDRLKDVNFITGIIPLLTNAIKGISIGGELSNMESQSILLTLGELHEFVKQKPQCKYLLVDFKIINLVVDLVILQGLRVDSVASNLCYMVYELLYTIVSGEDSDVSLYVAQFMTFMQTQILYKPCDSLSASRVITVLIKDKQQVMDRMTPKQIDSCIWLMKKYKHPVYLQLLSTLCVCSGIAIPENQKLIYDSLIYKRKGYLYKFELNSQGQVCVWKKTQKEAVLLSDLLRGFCGGDTVQETLFIKEQLILLESLCHGRNHEAIEVILSSGYLSFNVAFAVLKDPEISEEIQALFCRLIACLFIEVDDNTPVRATVSAAFRYDELDPKCDADTWLNIQSDLGNNTLWIRGPEVLSWVIAFLKQHSQLDGNTIMRNKLILAKLKLVNTMIDFGYCDVECIQEMLPVIMDLMTGEPEISDQMTHQPMVKPKGGKKLKTRLSAVFPSVMARKNMTRHLSFRHNNNTEHGHKDLIDPSLVAVKYQAIVLLELLMDLQRNYRLHKFVGVFKEIEINERTGDKDRHPLADYLYGQQDNKKHWWWNSPKEKLKSALESIMKDMSFVSSDNLTKVLVDLAGYNTDEMTTKALSLLNKYCNKSTILFNMAQHAQVLLTEQSIAIYLDVQKFVPLLRRIIAVKIHDEHVHNICTILQKLTQYCFRTDVPERPNTCAQNVLVNHGLLPLLVELLQMEEHDKKGTSDIEYEGLMRGTLQLLYAMSKGNDNVQDYLFENISVLLSVRYAVTDLAEVLKEIFLDNSSVCWSVDAQYIEKIFLLIHQHKNTAPNLIQVLQNIVVVKHGEGYIKRNQDLVMRVGSEKHPEFSFIFELPKDAREKVLMGQSTPQMRSYLVHMLNLITLCSKDTKGPVQSFCQNLLSVEEVISVLNNDFIPNNIKRPYLKYFTSVCLQSQMPGQTASIMHLQDLWGFLERMESLMSSLLDYLKGLPFHKTLKVVHIEDDFVPITSEEIDQTNLFYFVDGIIPMLEEIIKLYKSDNAMYLQPYHVLKKITSKLFELAPFISAALIQEKHFISLKIVIKKGAICTRLDAADFNTCMSQVELNFEPNKPKRSWEQRNGGPNDNTNDSTDESKHDLEYNVNCKLQNFVKNCMTVIIKKNTVGAQLGVKNRVSTDIAKKKYTNLGSSEALPLSIDFQNHVKAFFQAIPGKKPNGILESSKFIKLPVLIRKLEIIAVKAKVGIATDDQHLELRTLQILRAILHNNIVLIPDHVEGKKRTKLTKMTEVVQLQDFLVNHGVIPIILDLLICKSGAVFREVLALLNCLLYDAHGSVQNETIGYFKRNRDEMFFKLVLDFLKQASMLAKERRALENQMYRQKVKEQLLAHEKHQKKSIWKFLKSGKQNKVEALDRQTTAEKKRIHEDDEFKKEQLKYFRDDGTLQLVFKVMAKLCDGQHKELQNYLREQPDNPRSYNLVASVTQYLQITFHSITADTIHLIIQVFTTLSELCAGNQENRIVIRDGKVIDYINFILRNDTIVDCELEDVFKLYKSIAELLIAMIEESSPEAFRVAKDVGNTIDVCAVASTMQKCYDFQTSVVWGTITNLVMNRKLTSAQLAKVSDLARRVGYKYYIVFARITDIIKPEISSEAYHKLLACGKALEYYRGNVLSIEVNKEGHLQKIYFPVANYKNLIRTQVKESLKWSIDRSSATEKIRDFMRWSKLILKSIGYQQRIHKNIFSRFLTKYIMLWHYIMILLSLTINVIMLSTWSAKASIADVKANATLIPSDLYNPAPVINLQHWDIVFVCIAVTHNFTTFILVLSFFLAENPSLPNMPHIKSWFSDDRSAQKELKDTTKESVTHLLSFKVLYYILLFVMSMLGSFTYGYFFAFHLFDIATVNQLLQGVTRAVTLNGRSLIYVAILGLVFLYVYALLGFALFRPVFNPASELYCASLWQCSVTLVRYGLVGIDEVLRRNPLENTFQSFGYLVIYQVTFFIFFTTIGLNIIFGIIVDTFSELRDMKWRAEKDMQDFCFICSLPSYELEHHGKGFYHHVSYEHNMWAYIYYFIYLANTNVNDYTALDYYVYKLLDEENYGFFPMNKALCLMHLHDQPVEEDPVKLMAKEVQFLVRKANEKMFQKKIRHERKQRDKLKKKVVKKKPTIVMSPPLDGTIPKQPDPLPAREVVQNTDQLQSIPISEPTTTDQPPLHISQYKKGPNSRKSRPRSRTRTSERSSSTSPHTRSKSKSPHRTEPETVKLEKDKEHSADIPKAPPPVPLMSSEIKKKAHERRIKAFDKEVRERSTHSRPALRRHMTEYHSLETEDKQSGYLSDRDKSPKSRPSKRSQSP